MQEIVFSFIGDDKPGLVEKLSQCVSGHGGNWQESRLAQMAGKFAGIVSITIAARDAAELVEALEQLSGEGFSIVVETTARADVSTESQGQLAAIGNDRPGIVHEISAALAARHINIEELSSIVESAPMAGIPLFTANIKVTLPQDLILGDLLDHLDEIANLLDIDINLDIDSAGESNATT